VKRSPRERLTKNFTRAELRCRCRRETCDALAMDSAFMERLQQVREEWGKPLIVTSGARCAYWNKKVGGSPRSQHVFSRAVDLYFEHPNDVVAFSALAEKHGFGGIGVGVHLVHLDTREGKARWTYDDK